MTTEINKPVFTTKDEYLAWRAEWRADYAKLSEEIRDFKFARWAAHSRYATETDKARLKDIAANVGKNCWMGFCPEYALANRRFKAALMMSYRADSKFRAEQQYQDAKAVRLLSAV